MRSISAAAKPSIVQVSFPTMITSSVRTKSFRLRVSGLHRVLVVRQLFGIVRLRTLSLVLFHYFKHCQYLVNSAGKSFILSHEGSEASQSTSRYRICVQPGNPLWSLVVVSWSPLDRNLTSKFRKEFLRPRMMIRYWFCCIEASTSNAFVMHA